MKASKPCHRIVLAGEEGCRVLYCEDCNVAELEIGAMSLRLEAHAFESLARMVRQAEQRLALVKAAGLQERFNARSGNVH
jgi:hypothetical protein